MIKLIKKIFSKNNEPQESYLYEETTHHTYDFDNVTPLVNYFKNETGVTFEKQTSILKNKVTNLCKRNNIHSFRSLLEQVKTNETLKQELIDYLTTNETYFYREFNQIKELVGLVKHMNHGVSILCAPSATGEEPYSIAIALLEAGVSSENFHITGIDINQEALSKAKEAIYRQRNVRNLSEEILHKYFTQNDSKYVLDDKIKNLVTFKLTNIFDPSFKNIGKFDFIFSRNMLIYFDMDTKIKAKNILESLRKDNSQAIFFGHADMF